MKINSIVVALLGFICVAAFASVASADIKQLKIYKEAFPDAKLKCASCHVDEKPKKDDGAHELNDYGKKVVETAKEPTADTYKTVGAVENFAADKK